MNPRFFTALALVLAACDKTPSAAPAPDASVAAPRAVVDAGAPGEETPAGAVAIVAGDGFRQLLALNGKPIYPPATCDADQPACAKVKEVAAGMERLTRLDAFTPTGSKEKVILFQSGTMGNACSGGPMFFVRFRPDGGYRFSDPIDYCSGPAPTITRAGDVVRILVPAHLPARGTDMIPGAVSEYDLVADKLKTLK